MPERIHTDATIKRALNSRLSRWIVGIPLALALILFIVSFFLDEPLRRTMEKNINRDLKGYTVRLPKLHLQLLDLSLTLKEMAVLQQAHPDPPVVSIPVLRASIHWRGLFAGKLVAQFRLDQPNININLLQLRSEAANKVSLKERGWQQAIEDIYPLKINSLKINDATITYLDDVSKKPFTLSHLNLQAINIRNVNLPDQVYPSSFHLDTAIFDSGHGTIDGKANFLGEPFPGIKGRITLEKVPLDYFNSGGSAGSNLVMEGGVLGASGNAEYSPKVKIAQLETLKIAGMKIDYIHSQETAEAEKKRAVLIAKKVRELRDKPGLMIRADQLSLTGCNLGLVNRAARHPYRLFFADADLQLSNFSNQFTEGPAQASLQGKFMGSGQTAASVNFWPKKEGADFDLHLKIGETRLTAMNNLLLSYGDFDVSAGVFSLVSELHVKNYAISGYIKPFFKDVTVYDKRTDAGRGIGHQLYEKMIGGVARLLENRSSQEVATKANIAGSLKNPHTSSWEIVGGLFKNAFFKALLPSFDKEANGAGKR